MQTPGVSLVPFKIMANPKQPSPPEKTLEDLLDKVSNAREDLLSIERSLERLRDDIAKDRKPKNDSAT